MGIWYTSEGNETEENDRAAGEEMEEGYLYKNQKKLRWGYTTGTCAAAASLAAAVMLLRHSPQEHAVLTTPKGIRLSLDILDIQLEENSASCAVRKDGGDDPDVTNGLLICSRVFRADGSVGVLDEVWKSGCYEYKNEGIFLKLRGGVGVGTVTKPGLSCEVGKPAINPVPRQMIFSQVEKVCREEGFQGRLYIEIFVPGGRERAERTFNPKMGIVGGISILGTSGIVEPMSESALLQTIRLELRQKHLEGRKLLIMTPGNYGEAFLTDHLELKLEQAVKCSNYIGASIDMAAEEGISQVLLTGHGGKLIKLAAGIMNTHSSVADGRMEILAAHGAACGCSCEMTEQILESVTVDQALAYLEQIPGLREQVMRRIMRKIQENIQRRAGGRLQIEALVFTNERGILGMTDGAEALIRQLKEEDRGEKD